MKVSFISLLLGTAAATKAQGGAISKEDLTGIMRLWAPEIQDLNSRSGVHGITNPQIKDLLGSGSFGDVYSCDYNGHDTMAIKIIRWTRDMDLMHSLPKNGLTDKDSASELLTWMGKNVKIDTFSLLRASLEVSVLLEDLTRERKVEIVRQFPLEGKSQDSDELSLSSDHYEEIHFEEHELDSQGRLVKADIPGPVEEEVVDDNASDSNTAEPLFREVTTTQMMRKLDFEFLKKGYVSPREVIEAAMKKLDKFSKYEGSEDLVEFVQDEFEVRMEDPKYDEMNDANALSIIEDIKTILSEAKIQFMQNLGQDVAECLKARSLVRMKDVYAEVEVHRHIFEETQRALGSKNFVHVIGPTPKTLWPATFAQDRHVTGGSFVEYRQYNVEGAATAEPVRVPTLVSFPLQYAKGGEMAGFWQKIEGAVAANPSKFNKKMSILASWIRRWNWNLNYMFDMGYAHRDLKPQNFLVDLGGLENPVDCLEDPTRCMAMIADYGFVCKFECEEYAWDDAAEKPVCIKEVKPNPNRPGPECGTQFRGTPVFVSPETAQGCKDKPSKWWKGMGPGDDLFATGVVLWRLLFGETKKGGQLPYPFTKEKILGRFKMLDQGKNYSNQVKRADEMPEGFREGLVGLLGRPQGRRAALQQLADWAEKHLREQGHWTASMADPAVKPVVRQPTPKAASETDDSDLFEEVEADTVSGFMAEAVPAGTSWFWHAGPHMWKESL